MALDVYYPDDILGILRAIYVARDPKVGDDFCRALVAVAVGFRLVDIKPTEVTAATASNLLFGRKVIAASEPADALPRPSP